MASVLASKSAKVLPGQTAVAPKIDDPHGFALLNESDAPVTVSFRYDAEAHLMIVVVEGKAQPRRPLPAATGRGAKGRPAGDLPA